MTEALRALVVGAIALGGALAWLAVLATRTDAASPQRLIAELRLAQFSALLLTLAAAVYVGLAIANEQVAGAGLDIALAIGFFVVAGLVTTWEPVHALTALSIAWGAHGVVDLAHTADLLPAAIAPVWYPTACAIYDVAVAGLCYLPVLRR